jgi:hypothetical protein
VSPVFVLAVVFVIVAQVAVLHAARFRKDKTRSVWPTDIFRPALFTEEGQSARRLAMWVVVLGLLACVVGIIVLEARVHR